MTTLDSNLANGSARPTLVVAGDKCSALLAVTLRPGVVFTLDEVTAYWKEAKYESKKAPNCKTGQGSFPSGNNSLQPDFVR